MPVARAGRPWRCSPARQLAAGLLAGALFAGEFACIYVGLQYTSASRLTVFCTARPSGWRCCCRALFPASGSTPGNGWAWRRRLWAWGWRWATGWQAAPLAHPLAWLGDALGLAAGLMWALTTVVIRSTALARVAPEHQLLYRWQ